MKNVFPLFLLVGCAYKFDHTQNITIGPDPFDVDGSCTPHPLTTLNHDDGSVTTTQTEDLPGSCRFSGSWQGEVLDLEADVQSKLGAGASFVAIFWQSGEIDVTASDVRENGGSWLDVRTETMPGVTVAATATLFVNAPGDEPAVTIEAPPPAGGVTETVVDDQLLAAVEDGWYGQDPRLPILALAEGSVEITDAELQAHSGSELEVRLGLDLTLAGVACVLGHEPDAGSHNVESGCGEPSE